MTLHVTLKSYEYQFPGKDEPAWSKKVERWYQLDAYAYGLAQAYTAWNLSKKHHPDLMILASPGASNLTDAQFVQTGASSPAKFVHTLPNIRSSSLGQVMDWGGPLLCIQNDPMTQLTALSEAAALAQVFKKIWVLTLNPNSKTPQLESPALYRVDLFALGSTASDFEAVDGVELEIIEVPKQSKLSSTDLTSWLSANDNDQICFKLLENYEMKKRDTHPERNHV